IPLEKQRLAQDGRHCRGLEWFGDLEGRLRPLAREETLGISRNEDYRHFKSAQHLVYGVQSRTAVGKLNVSEDDAGPLGFRERNRFAVGPRDSQHAVPETFNQAFEVECNECLVFDDQHVRCDFSGEFTAGFLHEFTQGWRVNIENLRGVVLGQTLKRDQQKGLTRLGRNLREMALDGLAGRAGGGRPSIQRNGIPDLREQAIEGNPRRYAGIQNLGVLDQGLQSCSYISVTGGLAARQGPRVAAEIG